MTGYASTTLTLELSPEHRVQLDLSLKALNSRFFEVTCKLPTSFNALETEFIRQLKPILIRGNVILIIGLSDVNAFKIVIEPSWSTLNGYMEALTAIKKTYKIEQEITISDVIRLPNIFNAQESKLTPAIKNILITAVQKLAETAMQERATEGNKLLIDIKQRIELMQRALIQIVPLFEKDLDRRKQEIAKQLQTSAESAENQAELQRSILFVALDKMDIHEEITRFQAHLDQLNKILDAQGLEKGKQLDFTLQELGREINTMLAKTTNPTISSYALTMKVEIEKARELAQNIV